MLVGYLLFSREAAGEEGHVAAEVGLGIAGLGPVAAKLHLLQRGLLRPGIYLGEEIALPDLLSLDEVDGLEQSGDLRSNDRGIQCLDGPNAAQQGGASPCLTGAVTTGIAGGADGFADGEAE